MQVFLLLLALSTTANNSDECSPIGRGVFGTRIERDERGRIDWERTRCGRPQADPDAPVLELSPNVFSAFMGYAGAVRLTCRVPHHAENRELEFGFDGWTSSTRPLEGANARITHSLTFEKMPCFAGNAYCRVIRAGGRSSLVTREITIAGCEP